MKYKDKVDNIVNYFKEKRGLDDPEFKEWLLSKEEIGYVFTPRMLRRIYMIQRRINKGDDDMVTLVTGYEGIGKSCIAILQAMLTSPSFGMKHICYTQLDFIRALKESKKGDSILLDEGATFLLSREAMTKTNREVLKIFTQVRQKNLSLIVCFPNLWDVDKKIREHRLRSVVYAYKLTERLTGRESFQFRAITKTGINIINKAESKLKTSDLLKYRLPKKAFFDGRWYKWGSKIPDFNDFTWDKYSNRKGTSFNDFLNNVEADIIKREGGSSPKIPSPSDTEDLELITKAQAKKLLPLSEGTYIKWIKTNYIWHKKIYGKWFFRKNDILNLVNKEKEGV
jgi:hypothetical protein|tara:strand:+ start:3127 stop:4146 length:1020 start_codon:yes stop_codon:yes gene_type:complete